MGITPDDAFKRLMYINAQYDLLDKNKTDETSKNNLYNNISLQLVKRDDVETEKLFELAYRKEGLSEDDKRKLADVKIKISKVSAEILLNENFFIAVREKSLNEKLTKLFNITDDDRGLELKNAYKALGKNAVGGFKFYKKDQKTYLSQLQSDGVIRNEEVILTTNGFKIGENFFTASVTKNDIIKHMGLEDGLIEVVKLHSAVKKGDIELVRNFIKSGVNLETLDKNGRTAIFFAIRTYNLEIAKLLIENISTLDVQDLGGESALHYAVIYNNVEIAKLLIQHGARLDLKDDRGYTPLYHAITNHNIKLAQFLIEQGAMLNQCTMDAYTIPYYLAAADDKDEFIKELFAKSLLKVLDKDDNTLLIKAIMLGDERGALALIKFLTIFNIRNNSDSKAALHFACERGFKNVVRGILEISDRYLDYRDKYSNAPLFYAVMSGNEGCVNVLIQKSADINILGKNNDSSLVFALKYGKESCAKLLIKAGAKLDVAKLDEVSRERFGKIVKLIELEKSLPPIKVDQAADLYKQYFLNFLCLPEMELDQDLIEEFSTQFSLAIDRIYIESPKDTDEQKTEILVNFLNFYMETIFEIQEDKIERGISSIKSNLKLRFNDLEETLAEIQYSYKEQEKYLLQRGKSISQPLLEITLKKILEKAKHEIVLFSELMRGDAFKGLSSEIRKHIREKDRSEDLYLRNGICSGAALIIASMRVHGKFDETIQPSRESRFFQAALSFGIEFNSILNKTRGAEFQQGKPYELIDNPFQKKLNIKIESTANITKTSVFDFIQKLDDIIFELSTEKSSSFILVMNNPKGEESDDSGHAIYCKLSPPYEIQDANRPGYSIKTSDIQEFKMYLYLYFLCQAPGNYKSIIDVYRIIKKDTRLQSPNIEESDNGISKLNIAMDKLTIDDLTNHSLPLFLEKLTQEEKEKYLIERQIIYQEKNPLNRAFYLEILDTLIAMHVIEGILLENKRIDEYFKGKSDWLKNALKDAVKRIFLTA